MRVASKSIRRKSPKQKRKEHLDHLVRDIAVFPRDNWTCVRCGKTREQGVQLHPAHILGKGAHPRLRYEPWNILTMCMQDHLFWWHKEGVGETRPWLESKWPRRFEQLEVMSAAAAIPDVKELTVIYEHLKRANV